jgi:hypothetical protein
VVSGNNKDEGYRGPNKSERKKNRRLQIQTPVLLTLPLLFAAAVVFFLFFVKIFYDIESMKRAGESAHGVQVDIMAAVGAVSDTEEETSVMHKPRVEYKRPLISVAGVLGPTHKIGVIT